MARLYRLSPVSLAGGLLLVFIRQEVDGIVIESVGVSL
jgi:hypothetical protein